MVLFLWKTLINTLENKKIFKVTKEQLKTMGLYQPLIHSITIRLSSRATPLPFFAIPYWRWNAVSAKLPIRRLAEKLQ